MVLKGSPGTVLSTFEDWIIQVRISKQLFMHQQKQQLVSRDCVSIFEDWIIQVRTSKQLFLQWTEAAACLQVSKISWKNFDSLLVSSEAKKWKKMPKARGHSLQILDVTNHHLVVRIQVAFSSFQRWNRPWKLYWGQIPNAHVSQRDYEPCPLPETSWSGASMGTDISYILDSVWMRQFCCIGKQVNILISGY
jgi:hypothetical protein